MKRRSGLVSNSSSSSYYVAAGARKLEVWPIFAAAAEKHPDIDFDDINGEVIDQQDNATSMLCYNLGIDIFRILDQYAHNG